MIDTLKKDSLKKKKLVAGVGINDAGYPVTEKYKEGGKYKTRFLCPFYQKWVAMLGRCKKSNWQREAYKDCCVNERWHLFSNFKSWMQTQNWEGKALDKDILFPGNKEYGPDYCVFVDHHVNNFICEGNKKSNLLIGATRKVSKSGSVYYEARCRDNEKGLLKSLGYFKTEQAAHEAWLMYKLDQAKGIASKLEDLRVAKALVERYENYNRGTEE